MDSPCIKQTVCKVLKIFQYGKYLVAYVLKGLDINPLPCGISEAGLNPEPESEANKHIATKQIRPIDKKSNAIMTVIIQTK